MHKHKAKRWGVFRPVRRIAACIAAVWATRSWWKRSLLAGVLLILLFVGSSVSLTLIYAVAPVPVTPLMLIRANEFKKAGKPTGWRKTWVGEQGLSSHLKLAVICAEDQNFLHHRGFDYGAIEKAMEHNKRSRRKRGASTISMQTAKNVFLWPGRSWLRKGLEVWFTMLIETIWSKRRIMTVYLNIAEWGPGIYGAEAASQAYFKKPAARLTPSEAALLAAVLPSPLRYSVTRPGPFVQNRRDWVLRQMELHGGAKRLEANPKW